MYKKGIILAIMAAVISGVSIFSNGIFVTKTDPVVFAFVRNVVVAVILSFILWVVGGVKEIRGLGKKEWGKLLIIGAIGGGIPFAMFFTGLSMIGAVNGNAINKTLFIWVALLAVPLLHERISRMQLLGYGIVLFGMFVFGQTLTLGNNPGTWLILGATLLWAIEHVIAKVALREIAPIIVGWGRIVFGLPFLLIGVLLQGKSGQLGGLGAYMMMPLLLSSMLLTAYIVSWYTALSKAPATLVSSILIIAPVVTALLSSVILQKMITRQQGIQQIVIALGVVCITWVFLRTHQQRVS